MKQKTLRIFGCLFITVFACSVQAETVEASSLFAFDPEDAAECLKKANYQDSKRYKVSEWRHSISLAAPRNITSDTPGHGYPADQQAGFFSRNKSFRFWSSGISGTFFSAPEHAAHIAK